MLSVIFLRKSHLAASDIRLTFLARFSAMTIGLRRLFPKCERLESLKTNILLSLSIFNFREPQPDERHHHHRRGLRGHRQDVRGPAQERLGAAGRHDARLQGHVDRLARNYTDTFRKFAIN